jgi:hypothetical protein
MDVIGSLFDNSSVLHDTLIAFVSAYIDCSELMVSSLFAKIGVYNVAKDKIDKELRASYRQKFKNTFNSYIWTDLGHLSTSLRSSLLYTTLCYGDKCVSRLNDSCLSSTLRSFKADMAKFIHDNAFFISYCEIEKHEVFLFTNGIQGLQRTVFLEMYENICLDFNILYEKYKNRLCKPIKGILDDFTYVLDIRIQQDERLCKVVENKALYHLTKNSKIDQQDLKHIIHSLNKGSIVEVQNAVKKSYTIMIPFYVIMDAQWFFIMQGVKKQNNVPLKTYFTDKMFEDVITIRDTILNFDGMYVLKEMIHLNFLNTVFQAVNDRKFFMEYSTDLLGEYAHCYLRNITKIFTRNIDLIVLADLLSVGIYDMLGIEWQMKLSQVQAIIDRANLDIKNILEHYQDDFTMKRLTIDSLYQLRIYLKKVERYQQWLSSQIDQDNIHNYTYQKLNDMIFGNVTDKEGNSMTCAICLDTADERKDTWFPFSCEHCYHLECINTLASNNIAVCPLCRQCIN